LDHDAIIAKLIPTFATTTNLKLLGATLNNKAS
jgi:hypothetical protein